MEPRTTPNARKENGRNEGWGFNANPDGFSFLDRIHRIYRIEEDLSHAKPQSRQGIGTEEFLTTESTEHEGWISL
jgi:hypothetical protein